MFFQNSTHKTSSYESCTTRHFVQKPKYRNNRKEKSMLLGHFSKMLYLSLLEFWQVLNSCCDTLVNKPLLKRTTPMITDRDLDGPKLLVLLLQSNKNSDWIGFHIFISKFDTWNFKNTLIWILVFCTVFGLSFPINVRALLNFGR